MSYVSHTGRDDELPVRRTCGLLAANLLNVLETRQRLFYPTAISLCNLTTAGLDTPLLSSPMALTDTIDDTIRSLHLSLIGQQEVSRPLAEG